MNRLFLFTLLAGSLAYSAPPEPMAPTEFHAPEQEKLLRVMRRAMPSRNRVMAPVRPHVLPAVNNEQLRRNARDKGGMQVGIHRKLEPAAMQSAHRDGSIWRMAIQSPDATAMRLHFTHFSVGTGQVWIHDGSGDEDHVLGPYVGTGPNNDSDFWSATVFSDTATVEYEPAEGQRADGEVPFVIEEVSHQFSLDAAPRQSFQDAAASCELDVNCYADWTATAKGVARISFEKSDGTYNCTGTLLNTRRNANIPYLLTANHCISTDAVAHTLEAMWFYQKDKCNGTLPRTFPRTVGAGLVATGDPTKGDFSLLRLTSMPDGVTLQGWDPTEQPVGKAFTVIHHPNADYKRISFGKIGASALTGPNLYFAQYTQGITEHGSSGAGMYSAPGVLVGDLSTGLTAETTEGYCRINPYTGSFGKFSSYYPYLRDALEGQTSSSPSTSPPAATGETNPLTSGVPVNFTLAAVNAGSLLNGKNGFSITVPQGATRLDITLRTTTANADLDLYVRYGQDVSLNANGPVADFLSQGPGGNEQITITSSGTPALRAGTYYIGLGQFTTKINITATLTATVTSASSAPPPSGSSGGNALTSGVSQSFAVPPVNSPTLFSGKSGFTIDVPQGATRLEVKLASNTKGADLDLYVSYGQDVSADEDGVIADYWSEGEDANESIVITAASDPPLKAGTYYIGVVSWNPGVAVDATITATVATDSTPPPSSGSNVLTSGRAQSFSFQPVNGPTIFTGDLGFRITVPQGATSLDIVLHTATPNADLDLFARYGQDVAISNGDLVADYGSDGPTGEERITINASSNPPLRAGTYYIGVAMLTPGVTASGTVTATVNGGGSTPPPPPASGGPAVLTSGRAQPISYAPVSDPTFFNGNKSYVIDVPANSSKLDIQLTSSTPGVDMDLLVSYAKDNSITSDGFVADYGSDGPTGNERVIITPGSTPPLRPGRYYISIVLYTTGTNVTGSLVATVTDGNGQAPPSAHSPADLTPGQPARFSLPAVTVPTVFSGDRSFRVVAPPGAVVMRIQVATDSPVNLAVLARYRTEVGVDVDGNVLGDYAGGSATGTSTTIISTHSQPPLQPGQYNIALALLVRGVPASGTITVTFSNDVLAIPNTTGNPMTSGMPESYRLPAVTSPTMFAGSTAYRISVDKRHRSLRLSLKQDNPADQVTVYVRRGRQPEVVNGNVVADFMLEAGSNEDLVVQGARLRPGVYYMALGQHTTGTASSGTVTATLTAADGDAQELQLAPAAGIRVSPKASGELRFSLPDINTPLVSPQVLAKHSRRLNPRKALKLEVSR